MSNNDIVDEFDSYNYSLNYRHKDNLSPEFQVRMVMYDLNSKLIQSKYNTATMKEIDNMLRLLSVLLNSSSKYTPFNFKKFINDSTKLNEDFREHTFNSYVTLIAIAKRNGMWTIDIIDEVIE